MQDVDGTRVEQGLGAPARVLVFAGCDRDVDVAPDLGVLFDLVRQDWFLDPTGMVFLQAAGHRVGLYTSPHLHSMRERIAVDGTPISEGDFARLTETLAPQVAAENADGRFGELTTFELATALAFLHFREANAQWQVLEVGMGGRLDATNVLEEKALCIITPLSLEHTSVLGETVVEIAAEIQEIVEVRILVVIVLVKVEMGQAETHQDKKIKKTKKIKKRKRKHRLVDQRIVRKRKIKNSKKLMKLNKN